MSNAELLEGQAYLYNEAMKYVTSMSLKCAIELGIPEAIHNHGKPITISDLVAALSINPSKAPYFHQLIRVLVSSGLLSREKVSDEKEEEGYVLTNVSTLLLKDNPLGITKYLQVLVDPGFMTTLQHTSAWFKNEDSTAFHTAHGRSYWDYTSQEKKFKDLFNEGMGSDSRLVLNALLTDCNKVFDGLETLVDAGGGIGIVAKVITEEFPHLQYTVLDLPQVVSGLKDTGNVKYIGGDMLKAIPPADAVLLKDNLQNWNDEDSVKILKQCKEAIKGRKGGKVIIIDMISGSQEDDNSVEGNTKLLFQILTSNLTGGQERNEKEWSKLFSDAGFSHYEVTPILGLRSVIEVYP